MGEISFFGPNAEVSESFLRKIRSGNSVAYCTYDFDWFSVAADDSARHVKITAVMPKSTTTAELVTEFKKAMRISEKALVWFASTVDYDGPIAYSREKTEFAMISLGPVSGTRNKKYKYQPNFKAMFYQEEVTLPAETLRGQVGKKWLDMSFYFIPDKLGVDWEQRILGCMFGEVYTGCLTHRDRSSGGLLREVLKCMAEDGINAAKRSVSLDLDAYQAYFLLPPDYVIGDRKIDLFDQEDYWNQYPHLEMIMIPEKFLKL